MAAVIVAAISQGGLFTIVAVFAAVLGSVMLAIGILEARHWEPLECTHSLWPLELGATETAILTRQAKTRARNRSVQFTGEVLCQEKVTYQQGTDTVTKKEIVYRQRIDGVGEVKDNLFRAEVPLIIPLDRGGPTLALNHNEITWRLDLRLANLSRLMRYVSFEIEVAPVLSSSATNIQDATP